MFVSPPFLPTRANLQTDEDWLADAMSGGDLPGDGFFPISQLEAWHGGLHLRAPASTDASGRAAVCAIANGTVAYRREPAARSATHSLNYHGSDDTLQWTDNGVVVLRHELELGPGDLQIVVVFSICMHLSQLAARLPAVGQPIRRKTPLGRAGAIAGTEGLIHFEIVAAPDQIAGLCGRGERRLDTASPGRTNVFGSGYARLPAGTVWKDSVTFPTPLAPSASPAHGIAAEGAAYTSAEELYVGMHYENASCVTTLYKENGELFGTRTDAQAHYPPHDISSARYPSSPAAGYELMRYGRILGPQALAPAGAPHWRELPQPGGGTGWVDLNAAAVRWFSDSDFPHWRGWQLAADDTDGDVRCSSEIVSTLRRDGIAGAVEPSLTTQASPQGNMDRLKNLVCLFPTEWDESDAGIDQRYAWVKTLPMASGDPEANYEKFKGYIKALGFWRAAALVGIPETHWHLNPRSLVAALRGPCVWPDLAQRWQNACTAHDLPDDSGLTDAGKTYLYEYALRSSEAASRNHTDAPSTASLSALDNGNAVIFGMREQTDIDANNGNGLWDDRVTVLKKESTGLTELAHSGGYTTEPSGRYLDGGQFKSSNNGSNVNVGGTHHFDSGRLIADRSYEYQPFFSSGYGPNVSGTTYNILKKTQSSFVERLVTSTSTLPAGTHVSGANTTWITGTTPAFGELRTMHFHRGYNGMTGSAGCQTFPVAAGETFMTFMAALGPLMQGSRYQYVLKGM